MLRAMAMSKGRMFQVIKEAKKITRKEEEHALREIRKALRDRIWEKTGGFERIVELAIKDLQDENVFVRTAARKWLSEYCLGPPKALVELNGKIETEHTLTLEQIITEARKIPQQPFDVIEMEQTG